MESKDIISGIVNTNIMLHKYSKGELTMPYVQEILLINCYIAGTYYSNAREFEQALNKGDKLKLIREPNNKYDNLAILVKDSADNKLGYMPRVKNEVIARLMDAGKVIYAIIDEKLVEDYHIEIKISVFMKDF